jgi:phosphatidylinositol-3-phosphatase
MARRVHTLGGGLAATATMAVLALSCTEGKSPTGVAPTDGRRSVSAAFKLPPIHHVFVVFLENEDASVTFSPSSPAHFLNDTLVKNGVFVTQYFGTSHASLGNYTSFISGQGTDSALNADCDFRTNFVQKGTAPMGLAIGQGCVFPTSVQTVVNQLAAKHLTWKGYMEDMGNDPDREGDRCGRVPIGAKDITNDAEPGDMYAARHDPFVWFHSITNFPACNNVVPLSELEADLSSEATTPNFAFITPNVCHDGHDQPCVDGEPGGLVSADAWLHDWIPLILNSEAFKEDGVLLITTDESEGVQPSGADNALACCDEQPGPNIKLPGGNGPGGGRVAAVMLSRFIKPGTVSNVPYNHFSALKSIEQIFGVPFLGMAGQPGLSSFGADIFSNVK